jgi:molybdopterin synthase sulfur carrier subunit
MRLVYFAWVRERIGTGEEQVTPPADVATVAELIDWLASNSAGHAAAFAERDRLRAAVDGVFVGLDASVVGVDEVAIFPPVTGG